ncbi:serine hydrolase domain-containing protein [Streptomyces sp. FXJ1.4098]|nr:serine hydrolase domain-containing protein [Streptomyces sp. FXJ1.4098]
MTPCSNGRGRRCSALPGSTTAPRGAAPGRAERLGDSLAEHQPPRVRPPGKVSSYDNYGVALAGYLVELASGEPFAAYVDRHILRPLGMTRTSFAQPHPAAIATARADGYRPTASGRCPPRASTAPGPRPAPRPSPPPPTWGG